MALRVAFGVLLASCIQTRAPNYDVTDAYDKKWLLFPSWYYLGGLSYCAVAVLFTTGTNIGSTLMTVWLAFAGVGMALVYNIILFAIVDVRLFDSEAENPYEGFVEIKKAFNASSYWVNTHNFYTVLPWMVLFTVAILVLPFAGSTKKFALANNLYFSTSTVSLTIISPENPLDGSKLKSVGDSYFNTFNILRNLEVYFLVGFVGTLISLVIMFVPYPIFAIHRLREDSKRASEDILELLNIIVDSYCFKNKNVDHMTFLKLKLHRKFDTAAARHRRMLKLLDDAWWEQLFGFNYLLRFHRPIMLNYVKLVGSLISDLRTLSYAMQMEKYEQLHFTYMKVLQREIYVIQTASGDLLNEISTEVHSSSRELKLQSIARLEAKMETTLHRYRSTQNRTLRTQPVTLEEMAGNVPLNLFLFSLNSFCSTMINFQETQNKKNYTGMHRVRSFTLSAISFFFRAQNYTDTAALLTALKGVLAIVLGILMSVYVYDFNATVPSTVAYVMGNHLGGSFSVTVNRVGGVVAGSIIPSVFQFFIVQTCHPQNLNVVLSDIVLFIWVGLSMYVRFVGGYSSYAGLVSAFVSTGILMRQSDACYANGSDNSSSIAISSYSSLAQTSVGIVLFIVVELALCPESATSLLRKNIQQTLKLQLEAFEVLFGHHLTSSGSMDADTMETLREILQVKIPAQHEEQTKLLSEAQTEPLLWRPAFSLQKYEKVLHSSRRLLNNNNLLFKLVRWFSFRVEHHHVQLNAVDIRDSCETSGGFEENGKDIETTHTKWKLATTQFQSSVVDSFSTLQMLFGDSFLYSDPDQTAVFMQMKEAFRMADKDCSGEIDAEEVAVMLETIFAQSGAVKEGEIHKYVQEFMEVVDKDNSGMVSFEEFMEALENGLKLEVEIYHRRKPKTSALTRRGSLRGPLPCITEDMAGDGSYDEALSAEVRDALTGDGQTAVKVGLTADLITAQQAKISSSRVPSHSREAFAVESSHRSSQASSLGGGRKPSSASSSPMCREHDVLNVEDFSTGDIAAQMKAVYVEWLIEERRYEKVSMEELLLLNCLVSGAEGIAKNLTDMEEIVVAA
ncbi:hypothetical protein BBJ28_00002643 [Nothophytophthora sp. Chile5]|nr:hypothetical protein BBJ28_00002643 [Nothophytophthora sp. Chile5]